MKWLDAVLTVYATDLPGAFFAAAGGAFTQARLVQRGQIGWAAALVELFGCFLLGYCAHALFRGQFADHGLLASSCIVIGIVGSPAFRWLGAKYYPGLFNGNGKDNDHQI